MFRSTKIRQSLKDEELFSLWLNNQDHAAYNTLIDRKHDEAMIRATALMKSFFPQREIVERPEDIVQDAIIKLSNYRFPIENFSAMLMVTIYRIVVDLSRKYKRQPSKTDTSLLQTLSEVDRHPFEEQQILDFISSGLSADERNALRLFLDGFSYEEIASSQNKTEGQIRGGLYRARQCLRNKFPFFF